MNIEEFTKDISDFFGISQSSTRQRLEQGFHYNHHEVAKDFFESKTDVNSADSLLHWYRNTNAYIWELSSYHLDKGFNYLGMCEGISLSLLGADKKEVLNIGDGIGTLSIVMAHKNLTPTYHDLKDSQTARFAQFRFKRGETYRDYNIETLFTDNFQPILGHECFDAVVALDFLEHVVNVEEWAKAVFHCLKKNGVFIAQNAFAIGDVEHGNSIPMHLAINNKYETEWASLLIKIGFVPYENNSWWQKP